MDNFRAELGVSITESSSVGGDVVFTGLGMNSESGFLIEMFQFKKKHLGSVLYFLNSLWFKNIHVIWMDVCFERTSSSTMNPGL